MVNMETVLQAEVETLLERLTHTGNWAFNIETGESFWSPEMFRICGLPLAQVPPPLKVALKMVHPADVARISRVIAESLSEGAPFRFQARLVIAPEQKKWAEVIGHPVPDEGGRVVEFIGLVRDVTDRIHANHRVKRAIKEQYEAVLAERLRIAREMHDGLLQNVTGIALELRALLPHVRATPEKAAETLERVIELSERTSKEARQAVVGLRYTTRSGDVIRAVQDVVERAVRETELAFSVSVKGRARPVSMQICDAMASIAHEATTNVIKHAHAQAIQVAFEFGRRKIRISIRDNGEGLHPDVHASSDDAHFGMLGMRERAADLGAALTVLAGPDGGTIVRVAVPYTT